MRIVLPYPIEVKLRNAESLYVIEKYVKTSENDASASVLTMGG